ncbi:type IV toxin-antitoxin system AbiEi family antitoxin domain-containing protein [Sporichthya brevicatena]|uniref:type IV toxin-antitoxin system AbiEi family antitoxin domain-containing protein n=1 Tax=Sporichthya brevicatena TaxID=171442 RepID=UPI0031DB5298
MAIYAPMRGISEGTGPFTLAHALAAGHTRADVRALTRSGQWIRLRRNVYVTATDRAVAATSPETLHAQDTRAVQLALSRRQVVGADTSAVRIFGLDLRRQPGDEVVLLTDDEGVASTHRDGYFLRVASLPSEQVTTCHGTPVTSPARTLLDVAANHGFEDGVVAAESAYRKKLITPEEFGAVVAAGAGRPGIHVARDVHEFACPLTESVLESVSRISFREAGIRMPLSQVYLIKDYPRIRVDFYWPSLRLVGEADGMAKYGMRGREPMEELRLQWEREQRLRDAGYDIVRWDWRIACSPRLLAARVLPAMARAEARLQGRTG